LLNRNRPAHDSNFKIPASYTKGKDKVSMEIRYVASPQKNEINEFYYWNLFLPMMEGRSKHSPYPLRTRM
jgi:hypothetical protein